MVYGRGIYMSEYPGVCLNYGKGLLLCKVLPGYTETISMDDYSARRGVIPNQYNCREVIKNGVAAAHIIRHSDQILPYCVIKLQPSTFRTTWDNLQLYNHRATFLLLKVIYLI